MVHGRSMERPAIVWLLLSDLGLRRDHRGGGVRAGQRREQPDLVPVSVFRARIALPSSLTCINAGGQSSSPASRPAAAGAVNPLPGQTRPGMPVRTRQHQ